MRLGYFEELVFRIFLFYQKDLDSHIPYVEQYCSLDVPLPTTDSYATIPHTK